MKQSKDKKLKVIGLTGGVGSGKTYVALCAREQFHIPVIFADEIGHLAFLPACETYAKVLTAFGTEILNKDHTINRNKLSDLVFADSKKLTCLNVIVHPFITKTIREKIAAVELEGIHRFLLLEAAILLESELLNDCSEVWYVETDNALRRSRLRENRDYTNEKIDRIMLAQLSDETMANRADKILKNTGGREKIIEQLEILLE